MSSIVSALQAAHNRHTPSSHSSGCSASGQVFAADVPMGTVINQPASRWFWFAQIGAYMLCCITLIGVSAASMFVYSHLNRVHDALLQQRTQQQRIAERVTQLATLVANQQDTLHDLQQQFVAQDAVIMDATERYASAHKQTTPRASTLAANKTQPAAQADSTAATAATAATNYATTDPQLPPENAPPASTSTKTQSSNVHTRGTDQFHRALPWQQAPKQLQTALDQSTISGHLFDKANPDSSFIIVKGVALHVGDALGEGDARVTRIAAKTVYVWYQDQTYFFTIDLGS